jgi:spore maturation protein CgeB
MREGGLRLLFMGLSVSSDRGHGHAGVYRALLRELADRGHRVTFVERETADGAAPRPQSLGSAELVTYRGTADLRERFRSALREADLVVLGSRLPDGLAVARWVLDVAEGATAFYDLDTPDTLAQLERGACRYLTPALVPRFSLYLSVTAGPALGLLSRAYGARQVQALPGSIDPRVHFPVNDPPRYDLGLLANHRDDRQTRLESLLLDPARRCQEARFVVAGSGYPPGSLWPFNVVLRDHVQAAEHRHFFAEQRFALNITRLQMQRRGHSPSARLFEAAACGTPIISDRWPGLEELFVPDQEILVVQHGHQVIDHILNLPEARRQQLASRARKRVLSEHNSARRAETFEEIVREVLDAEARRRQPAVRRPRGAAARGEQARKGRGSEVLREAGESASGLTG